MSQDSNLTTDPQSSHIEQSNIHNEFTVPVRIRYKDMIESRLCDILVIYQNLLSKLKIKSSAI